MSRSLPKIEEKSLVIVHHTSFKDVSISEGRTIRKVMGGGGVGKKPKKNHTRENAKKKNSRKKEGKEKKIHAEGRSDSWISHDVTVAMLVSPNNEMAAILVSRSNPPGIESYYDANVFFCFR